MFRDDLSRDVYCVLGIPIDAIEMPQVMQSIETAAANRTPLLLSTPNLNFLAISQRSPQFRESLLLSDLCPVDGMPILLLARLLGAPILKRVAGSDIFDELKVRRAPRRPLRIFLFGAPEGVAERACVHINSENYDVTCVGALFPGFGSVEDLSQERIITRINSSAADLLIAALGAEKGQLWLFRNYRCLEVPVRAHFGAAIGFQAGLLQRAPKLLRKLGLEWLWRIKEEPKLWIRYWNDGILLLRLMATRVLPLLVDAYGVRCKSNGKGLALTQLETDGKMVIRMSGFPTSHNVSKVILAFRTALLARKSVLIDLAGAQAIDTRFLGSLLMLRKQLINRGLSLELTHVPPRLKKLFRLHGVAFLYE
jgi:N-acetylglucosaminyldiphosphoundecaprenol N-acetyl-beta-D-mannosaminyltransferase